MKVITQHVLNPESSDIHGEEGGLAGPTCPPVAVLQVGRARRDVLVPRPAATRQQDQLLLRAARVHSRQSLLRRWAGGQVRQVRLVSSIST